MNLIWKPKNITSNIKNLLGHIQCRGKDSYGILTILPDRRWRLIKGLGEVPKDIETQLGDISGDTSIIHTRSATNGSVSIKNAHPFLSEKNNIALSHNGIIFNDDAIRVKLLEEGHIFNSTTDSEVILHLFESFWDGSTAPTSILKAWEKCVDKLSNHLNVIMMFPDSTIMGYCAPSLAYFQDKESIFLASTPFNSTTWNTMIDGEILIARRGEILLKDKVRTSNFFIK